jgi:hypothetical protein
MTNKDLLNKIITALSGIIILTFACGSYITNSFLTNYHIVDFNLLKPHAVITGFMFTVFLIVHVIVFLLFLNLKVGDNSLIRTVLFSAVKIIYLSLFLSFFFYPEYLSGNVFEKQFGGYGFLFIPGFIAFPLALFQYVRDKNIGKLDWIDKFYLIVTVLGAASTLVLFVGFFPNPDFQRLFFFELYFGCLFVLTVVSSNSSIEDKRSNYRQILFFENKDSNSNTSFYLALTLLTLTIIGSTLIIMEKYTKTIYPRISQSYGGGKLEAMTYFMKNDTISGNKIYESEKYIFILNNDSSISKIDWNDVTRVIH